MGDADPNSKMPLDTFTRGTPPGWMANIVRYPFRRYMQLLRLWHLQTDLLEERIGPAICGRLKGTAFQFAMNMRANRLNVNTGEVVEMQAPELFTVPAHDEFYHPTTGALLPAEPSGSQVLARALSAEFAGSTEDLQWSVMETFFDSTHPPWQYELRRVPVYV